MSENRDGLDWREMVTDEAMPLGFRQAAELPDEAAREHDPRCLYCEHGPYCLTCPPPAPIPDDAYVCGPCHEEITRREIAADPYYEGDYVTMFGDDE